MCEVKLCLAPAKQTLSAEKPPLWKVGCTDGRGEIEAASVKAVANTKFFQCCLLLISLAAAVPPTLTEWIVMPG